MAMPHVKQEPSRLPSCWQVASVVTVQVATWCSPVAGIRSTTLSPQTAQPPSLAPSAMQVAAAVTSYSGITWPRAVPSTVPHTEQVFALVQVASTHLCPSASPSVAPHLTQVLGCEQAASVHSWLHVFPPHPVAASASISTANTRQDAFCNFLFMQVALSFLHVISFVLHSDI